MAAPHIIRVPRTDEEGSFVLGEVTPSGSKPLNIKFVATEGEEPYVLKLRHDRIGDLRASGGPCSPEEWEAILKSLLLGGEPIEDIEAGAEASVGRSITITIRRRVAGINQRLGVLTLNHKADEAIQLFDWCGAAAQARERFQETASAERARVADLEARVAELRSQLEELTAAKTAREAELLEKFCGLLNEKKVKIREQQRLLSTAQADPSRLEAARARTAEPRQPAPSGRAKRKALEDASGGGSSGSDDDDAFEQAAPGADRMDVDAEAPEAPRGTAEGSETEDRQTTDDDATASGSEADEDEAPAPSPPRTRRARELEPKKGRAAAAAARTRTGTRKEVAVHPLKKVTRKPAAKAATPPPLDGSETESDDEL